MSQLEEVRTAIITYVDAYNRGVTNCVPEGHAVHIYFYVFCLVVGFLWLLLTTNTCDISLKQLLVVILASYLVSLWMICMIWEQDTATVIYTNSLAAVRYGCAHAAMPIRLNPIFEDKAFLTNIYNKSGGSITATVTHAITALRLLTIEYRTMNVTH